MKIKPLLPRIFLILRYFIIGLVSAYFLLALIGGIYLYRNKLNTWAAWFARIFPYPVAYAKGDIVRFSDWQKSLSYLKTFAQKTNQPFNVEEEGKKVLEEKIEAIFYQEEAQRLKITVSDSEVDQKFLTDVQAENSLDEIRRTLKEMYDMSVNDFKKVLKEAMIKEKVQQALLNNGTLMKASVSHILISCPPDADQKTQDEARAKAESIIKEIQAGKSFEEAAKTYSADKNSRDNGGKLGEISAGMVAPEFEKAVFEFNGTGLLPTPVKTDYGFHIIKLESKTGKYLQIEDWLKEQKAKTKIIRFI